MMSLVSAPVLGFDLVRHDQGDAVASVLLRALASDPADLEVFARHRGLLADDQRNQAWTQAHAGAALLRDSPAAPRPLHDVITDLRTRMIVDLTDLVRLVETDVLRWCNRGPRRVPTEVERAAGQSFSDAIAAVWAPRLADGWRHALAAPYLHAIGELPGRAPQTGPQGERIAVALDRLAHLDEAGRSALRATTAVLRPADFAWSAAMHEASWALLTTGRVQAGAIAQLQGVRAFRAGGLDASDGAEGVWNLISGYLQASVVADVLTDDVHDGLTSGWLRSIGH